MLARLTWRLLTEPDKRLLWKLFWNLGCKGVWSLERHKRRLRRGQVFPPFLYISIINSCNLRCQGCWVDVAARQSLIPAAAFHRLVRQARVLGNVYFGIVGGEPFLHPELLDMLAEHPDCYFQIFTNGHLLDERKARRLRQLGNVTPLISIEGNEVVSDIRRGRRGVLSRSLAGLQACLRQRLVTGVCTSLCQSNIDDFLREEWLDQLIRWGVLYTWFHVYRPMGPQACPELCLTPEQQLRVRRFVVEMRARKPIVIIDAYYDGQGRALCPAATGLSHHISPWGDIEPCPIVQFACESIYPSEQDQRSVRDRFLQSAFLRDFRELARRTTRGCIVLERPDLLRQLVLAHGARDTTARGTALAELAAMTPRSSQYAPGQEVPERHWLYRLAKRFWFSDFGAYDGLQTAAGAAGAGQRFLEATHEATGQRHEPGDTGMVGATRRPLAAG
jgi:MoaA/NifB/PqqE/SkfB family radical SAM enzyme